MSRSTMGRPTTLTPATHLFRKRLVADLKRLANQLGYTPTQAEVSDHFMERWDRLALAFVGRPGLYGLRITIGWHRWVRLAGLEARKKSTDWRRRGAQTMPSAATMDQKLAELQLAERRKCLSTRQWRCQKCARLNDPELAKADHREPDICSGCGAQWRGAAA